MADLWGDADQDLAEFAMPGDEKFGAQPPAAAETATAERPRGEDGRFVKAEERAADEGPDQGGVSEQTEPTAEETPAESDVSAQEAERLLAGKYKTAEDLERAYIEAQQALGKRGDELGQLRQLLEERFSEMEQRQAAPQVSDWQGLIDENPSYAAQLAYEHGNEHALRAAVAAWEDVAPGAPRLWADNVRMRQEFDAKLAAMEQRVGPVAQESDERQMGTEMARIMKAYPDLNDHADRMNEISRRPGNEHLYQGLAEGGAHSRAKVVETLYALARLESGDTLRTAAQDVARQASEEEQRARDEAVVVSATRSNAERTLSAAEQIEQQWAAMDDPLKSGWNI